MVNEDDYQTDEALIAAAEMSPCMGVCKQDDVSGWCFGCGRTDDEIDNWQSFDDAKRSELEAQLGERVTQLIARRKAERGGGTGRRSRRRG